MTIIERIRRWLLDRDELDEKRLMVQYMEHKLAQADERQAQQTVALARADQRLAHLEKQTEEQKRLIVHLTNEAAVLTTALETITHCGKNKLCSICQQCATGLLRNPSIQLLKQRSQR